MGKRNQPPKRLKKHANMIKALTTTSPKLRKIIIKEADKDLITSLCDCANNILKGNVPLSAKQWSCLRRHKQSLRMLTQRKSLAKKKKILQSGGFLGSLIAPVLGILGSVLSG